MPNKLVRDRIPQIIRDNGEDCRLDVHYRKANPEEMRELLEAKLDEEVNEYLGKDERDPDELADILEVLHGLAALHNILPIKPEGEMRSLEQMRREKLARSGGFWDRWVLFRQDNATPASTVELLRLLTTNTYWRFFNAGIGTRAHAFLEFVGLMSKYVDICDRSAKAGIDFVHANKHGGTALEMDGHDIDYIAEKFGCIFGPVFRTRPELAKRFAKLALGLDPSSLFLEHPFVPSGLYRVHARNFDLAIYDGAGGFIGVRNKLGQLYLFTERDSDEGPPHGTVRALVYTGITCPYELNEGNVDLLKWLIIVTKPVP